jgi:DNA-binding CsgD family transcriptional regulator
VVDLKRTYLELRATLRRVYTVVVDWSTTAPVLQVMGFHPLEEFHIGERSFVVACLDFGPGGVTGWLGRHVLAEQLPAPSPPSDGDADGLLVLKLTAREREVLALLAAGMTNAELARTLFISERTANRHVSNIFTKLGVHNRTQAARAAVAAGLAD